MQFCTVSLHYNIEKQLGNDRRKVDNTQRNCRD
jgi:hypothetical protein